VTSTVGGADQVNGSLATTTGDLFAHLSFLKLRPLIAMRAEQIVIDQAESAYISSGFQ